MVWREGAVAWATEYRGGEFSLVPIVFVGVVAVATLGVFALVLRALFVGSGDVRITTWLRRHEGGQPHGRHQNQE